MAGAVQAAPSQRPAFHLMRGAFARQRTPSTSSRSSQHGAPCGAIAGQGAAIPQVAVDAFCVHSGNICQLIAHGIVAQLWKCRVRRLEATKKARWAGAGHASDTSH
jgi:hypothetical protein